MNQFIFLLIVCVVTHIIRLSYEILKHKKIVTPDRLTFIIIFIDMAVLWASWFTLCGMDPSSIYIPAVIKYFGLLLDISGLILFLTALFTIKTLETYEGDLMTKGIYSKIRHPMYLGFIFWLIGSPLFYGGMYSSFMAVPFIINVLYWRYLEELELINRFSGYLMYKKKTIF